MYACFPWLIFRGGRLVHDSISKDKNITIATLTNIFTQFEVNQVVWLTQWTECCFYFDCLNQVELTHELKFTVIVMHSTTKNVKIVFNRYINTFVTTRTVDIFTKQTGTKNRADRARPL